ncbi:TonB-dependent receptor [Phenylobacterium sp. SCN 70-31]|uniref:TonB-dependent receptor n=1 Tax=Phenylobacterium sp. SCN 70-31 TaxID=1660129 RepID=UPI00086E5496|nr:TonB-dependent receptor [Phenylobacterium sp. SCN 70-31]ODT88374.1 MAG: hypothetical protein ABS78_07085 [Phenylobacterium sp. SCN 70-31]
MALLQGGALLGLTAGIGAAGPVWAETAAADAVASSTGLELEGLVVTARRREEALLDTPVTVTAVQGERLQNAGITELRDIVALIPNAVIQDSPESFNTFVNIRGMQVVDVQAEPNVGLYRNGLYIGGHRANLGAQVDIARVEVLRGPQGGFYGRSSVGGTVDIVYATPGPLFGGYAKAMVGSYDHTRIEGAVNLPLGERSSLRLTGWAFNKDKSELYNETLDEHVGAYTDRGVRIGYSLDVTDRTNVLWTFEKQHGTGPSLKTYAPFGISNFGAISTPETPQRIRRDTRSDANKDLLYLAQVIKHDFGGSELTLNASYRRYKFRAIADSDQTAIGPEANPVARQTGLVRVEGTEDYFVEGLWGSKGDQPFTWLAGVSYFEEEFNFARTITSRRATPSFGIQTGLVGFPKLGTAVTTKTLSGFVTLGYDVSDALSLEGSLRYSRDKKAVNFAQGVLPSGTGNAALDAYFGTILGAPYPTYQFNASSRFNNWSPSFTARYKFSPDMTGYVTYSTGFRPGAFNLSPTTVDTIPYGQETAKNYEAGLKGRFLDGRLQASVAAFYMRQQDLLLAQTTSLGGVDRTYLSNIGTGDTYGVELEVDARPTDWLRISAGLGWLDPHFDNAVSNPGRPTEQDLSGKLMPYTRRWTGNLFAEVKQPVSDQIDFVATASLRFEKGGVLGDYYVLDPYETMHKIDLSAGVLVNGRTRVTAFVNNLADEHISLFWYYNRGTNTSEGRTYGVDITHRF